tara:strand:+ start:9997 stop:10272 length:276 start_codon:yes stop_codon:yes gene_type:complete
MEKRIIVKCLQCEDVFSIPEYIGEILDVNSVEVNSGVPKNVGCQTHINKIHHKCKDYYPNPDLVGDELEEYETITKVRGSLQMVGYYEFES